MKVANTIALEPAIRTENFICCFRRVRASRAHHMEARRQRVGVFRLFSGEEPPSNVKRVNGRIRIPGPDRIIHFSTKL